MTYAEPGSGLGGAKKAKTEASIRTKKPLTDNGQKEREVAEEQRKKAAEARRKAGNRNAIKNIHKATKETR